MHHHISSPRHHWDPTPSVAHLYFNIPWPRPALQNVALCLPPTHTRMDSDTDSATRARRVLHACARVGAADRADNTSLHSS